MAFGLLLLATLLALNIWVTRRLLASDEDASRKKLFLAAVWLIPFFGALMVKGIGAAAPAPSLPAQAQREDAPVQLTLPSGVTFDLQQHLESVNGVPLLDWEAVQAAVEAEGAAGSDARAALVRAWLLHLRDAVGPHCTLVETRHAIVLSSLDTVTQQALLQYVASTRERVLRVLDGLADLPAGQKSVVLVLDDEESYYHYVATYYPDAGEFAFSSGMFISAGCPHFVVKLGELQALEPVIAHELTHSALAHLALPLWVDEGLAVNTEHRLTGSRPTLWTAQELHGKHIAFWDQQRIQEFWSGESFQRTDDGNLLSYDLASILVREMSRDWPAFVRFARDARRDDAGHAAAVRHLGIDLGQAVCVLFDKAAGPGWLPASPAAPAALAT
jgi:hypothetical protein